MECTQRLECTQDLYESTVDKTCPEQIGFLGICGTKYPVKRGPNKVGRDPQTCSIVLQLESISRQHAVINILNKTEFMLMDLDSANKTKLLDKTLLPYIPHPLKNGDTVQFGKIFGVFRLLEEDNELPMTQAIDIPETPVASRLVSRLHHAAVTTVPESPELSDREDSFIAPSQPKFQKQFNDERKHFIKPCAKTISIQPIGSKKIDNIYWNSSRRSTSIGSTLDESSRSINDSSISVNKSSDMNLHEMETQPPTDKVYNVSVDSIYNANTQLPNVSVDAIYTADTQIPSTSKQILSIDSIHTASTQVPNAYNQSVSVDSIYTATTQVPDHIHDVDTQVQAHDNLPNVRKVQNQQEMEFDFCTANKENDNSIFNAETQPCIPKIPRQLESVIKPIQDSKTQSETSKSSLNTSKEAILFEDVDDVQFQDEFESQSLLPESPNQYICKEEAENTPNFEISLKTSAVKKSRTKSDSSTDCDDDIEIAPTQQLPAKPDEDDVTDCEDDLSDVKQINDLPDSNQPNIVFEDMLTQVLVHEEPSKVNNKYKGNKKIEATAPLNVPFEDMLTQVINEDKPCISTTTDNLKFEDMPTQVICNEKYTPKKVNIEYQPTQVLPDVLNKNKEGKKISDNFISPFKIPFQSPRKTKRKDTSKPNESNEISTEDNSKIEHNTNENDEKYYEATQDLLDDLCTQAQLPPETLLIRHADDDVIPSSVEDNKTCEYKFPGLDYDVSPKSESNLDEKLDEFVTSLTKEQVRDVIGVQTLKRQPSDPSDTEATPKKVHPMKLFQMDLPDSQEIKTSVLLHYKSNVTESSSESETENDTEDQFTPILFRKKRKPKIDAKLNLTKKLDVDSLPSRVSTRVRKPALKIKDSEGDVKRAESILKPKFLTEQEGDISNEIIIENITRLKNKNDKNENNKSNTNSKKETHKLNNNTKSAAKSISRSENNTKDKRKSDDIKEDKSSITKHSKSKTRNRDIICIDLTAEKSKRKTRSAKNKQQSEIDNDTSSPSLEREKARNEKKEDGKRGQRSTKKEDKKEAENTKEVRRSRRQKSYKEKKENDSLIKVKIIKPAKKEAKPAPERSDLPAPRKRSAPPASPPAAPPAAPPAPLVAPLDDAPPAKRTRRARSQRVLFTAFPCEEVRAKLESLGAEIVSEVSQCSVLVTLHVKRTLKLLCAVGLGVPIVGSAWVQACADNDCLVDPWQHLLRDAAAERRFSFRLAASLAGGRGFLRGCRVSCTPAVRPPPHEMMQIVQCSGGTWVEAAGGAGGGRWLCVSCSADRGRWAALAAAGATLVSSELLLAGALRQRLDVDANRLM